MVPFDSKCIKEYYLQILVCSECPNQLDVMTKIPLALCFKVYLALGIIHLSVTFQPCGQMACCSDSVH